MSDRNPKFIVILDEHDNLHDIVLAHTNLHANIVPRNKPKVLGGGWWHLENHDTLQKLYLYKLSVDFGQATKKQIISAMKEGLFGTVWSDAEIYYSTAMVMNDDTKKNSELIYNPVTDKSK